MTHTAAFTPDDAERYNRVAAVEEFGPRPCDCCGNDPCTCGHHPGDQIEALALAAGIIEELAPGNAELVRLLKLADERVEAGLYLARGGDRL